MQRKGQSAVATSPVRKDFRLNGVLKFQAQNRGPRDSKTNGQVKQMVNFISSAINQYDK